MTEIIKQAEELALKEIEKYYIPKKEHFILANKEGQRLAKLLEADPEVVLLGTILMDLKIGFCFEQGRLNDHVLESSQAARDFLKDFNLSSEKIEKILNCIEQHHGAEKYDSLEAEICANADCYRFLSPNGFIHAINIFYNRQSDFLLFLDQLEDKIEEKMKILSLDVCLEELMPYYQNFKKLIRSARISA